MSLSRVLTFGTLVTLLPLLAHASGCDPDCTDYHRICPSFNDDQFYDNYIAMWDSGELAEFNFKGPKKPPPPDCSNIFYKLVCPRSCSVCTPCEVTPSDLNGINAAVQTLQDSYNALNQEVAERKAESVQFQDWIDDHPSEAEGYLLALRHTSNQITGTNFDSLYRYGAGSGDSDAADQYRMPNFHFFWQDTTSVALDIFNSAGTKHASIFFDIPGHSTSSQTSWVDVFNNNCGFVQDSDENVDYRDITQLCKKSNYFGDNRRLFLAQNPANDCNNIMAWFMVQNGVNNKQCDWEATMRSDAAMNNDNTYIFYNKFTISRNAQIALQPAQKIEMRISGRFVESSATNGFERVFRYPSYAGIEFKDYWATGVTDPTQDSSAYTASSVKTSEMYRDANFESKITGAGEIMAVIYDSNGAFVESLVYGGTGDMQSWFAEGNLLSTVSWNIQGGFNFYSFLGDDYWGRHFYINNNYGGCNVDAGYLLIACHRYTPQIPCASYESFPDPQALCKIMYTLTGGKITWESNQVGIASAMEIHVR